MMYRNTKNQTKGSLLMTKTKVNNMATPKPREKEDEENKGLEMKCNSCGHEWDYTGAKEFPAVVACPNCRTSVRLRKKDE